MPLVFSMAPLLREVWAVFMVCYLKVNVHRSLISCCIWFSIPLYLDNKCIFLDRFLVAQMFIRVEFLRLARGWGWVFVNNCLVESSGSLIDLGWALISFASYVLITLFHLG